jgi:hypothetical protein
MGGNGNIPGASGASFGAESGAEVHPLVTKTLNEINKRIVKIPGALDALGDWRPNGDYLNEIESKITEAVASGNEERIREHLTSYWKLWWGCLKAWRAVYAPPK